MAASSFGLGPPICEQQDRRGSNAPNTVGTKGTFTLRVQSEHLANQFKDAILPQVLATPVMILAMENAALRYGHLWRKARARSAPKWLFNTSRPHLSAIRFVQRQR